MLSKDKKYFALNTIIFEKGQTIQHKNLGYTAVIKRFLAHGNALIEIPNTPENQRIWACLKDSKGAYQIKATNLAKHFKHQILTLNL
jgi:hypothetical protein